MRALKSTQVLGAGMQVLKVSLVAVALLLPVMGVFNSVPANAQTAAQVGKIVKPLSGRSQAVVERLSGLNRLPAEEWRFHAGDLAHGESPDLDDSAWPLEKPRMEAPQDAVWFRRWIEVPQGLHGYDLTGARVWFRFATDANGPMPEISISTGGAWPWVMTWNRLCSSTRQSQATRCWWPSSCCTRWTRKHSSERI